MCSLSNAIVTSILYALLVLSFLFDFVVCKLQHRYANERRDFLLIVRERINMLYEAESHPLPDDKELIEKSLDEDSRSNSRIEQTVISQKHPDVAKLDSVLTSIDKCENDHLSVPTSGKAKTELEDDKYENDKMLSIIDKETENDFEEEKSYVRCGNPGHIVEKVFKPARRASKDLERSRYKKRAFSLLDTLISTSIVTPLTIGFWRGIWASMDRHAELFPTWLCFTFGVALHAVYAIFQDQFHNVYMSKWVKLSRRKRLPYRALRILYTYTFGVACIAHWRGGWIIVDNCLFIHMWLTTTLLCSLLACLTILRSVRNLLAAPLITLIDTPSCVFQFPTRYNVVVKKNSFSNLIARESSRMHQADEDSVVSNENAVIEFLL